MYVREAGTYVLVLANDSLCAKDRWKILHIELFVVSMGKNYI